MLINEFLVLELFLYSLRIAPFVLQKIYFKSVLLFSGKVNKKFHMNSWKVDATICFDSKD